MTRDPDLVPPGSLGLALAPLSQEELNGGLPAQVAERIGRAIVTGRLAPGTRLSEPELARVFNVSRTPIREALRLLEREELVTVTPRRGAQVSLIEPQRVTDIYVCRAYLYGLAAKLATRIAPEEAIDQLAEVVAAMEEAARSADVERYFELNVSFHERVASLAGNSVLLRMIAQLGRVTLRLRLLSVSLPGRLDASLAAHRVLLLAMRDRRPDDAESTVRRFVLEAGEALLRHHYHDERRADHLVHVLAGDNTSER